jgi:predicted DNA-binding transcriptional regulator YafY
MARGDQLARQWKIFQTLISSKLGKSVTDLAANLDCHTRTVYRDLEALQIAGFPLYDEKVNGKSLWCLLDTARNPMPIPFSVPELVALYFGRDAFKVLKDTVFYDSLESLFQKIVINRKVIEIVYFTMSRKKMTRREVDPYRLWYVDGGFYLIGYCRWKKEIRIFAIDRIKKLHLSDETFEVPDDFDVDELTKYSFGVFHDEPVKVRVHFSADVAGYIKEKVWHASQRIEVLDDGSVIFEAEVAGTEEIKFWIMRWGSNAYVLEPEELREEIQSEAAGMLVMYENGIVQEKKTLTA